LPISRLIISFIIGFSATLVSANVLPDSPSNLAPRPDDLYAAAPKGSALLVNNGAVTSAEVIEPIKDKLRNLAESLDRQKFIDQTLPLIYESTRTAVARLLLYQHAQQFLEKMSVPAETIESLVAEKRKDILHKYGNSEATALVEMEKQGLNLPDVLEEFKRQLIVNHFEDTHFKPSLKITRNQLLQYYRAHRKDDFYNPPVIQFQLIDIQTKQFLPADAADPNQQQLNQARSQALDSAQKALAQLQNGADFDRVVQIFSHGFRKTNHGIWRPISNPQDLQQQYQPIIPALEKISIGQYTGIIETDDHFFVAKLIDRREENFIPFSQVQSQISNKLYEQRWLEYRTKLYTQLLEKATISDWGQFVQITAEAAYNDLHHNQPLAATK